MDTPKCVNCGSEFTYELSDTTFGCSECGNEFTASDITAATATEKFSVEDSVGIALSDGSYNNNTDNS